ncbi:MAG: CBS domain-containing protein [Candidatus Woesearchaeota archaeon]
MIKLKDWMTRRIVTCKETDTLDKAVKKMVTKKIGCLIVTDSKKNHVGIITENDVMKIVAKEMSPKKLEVKDIMVSDMITLDISSSLLEVSRTMQKHHLRRIPITNEDKVVGIITSRDLVKVMSGVK